MDILQELNSIFQSVIDDTSTTLLPETTAQDVDDWDSLNHITFIVAIEKFFKIKFTSSEIRGWMNVGEMCKAIEGKLNA